MRTSSLLAVSLMALLLSSCDLNEPPTVPVFGDSDFISQTYPLTASQENAVEGIYYVEQGKGQFGDSVVIKKSGDRFAIFSSVQSGYFILETGRLDSVFFFQGYWRYQVSEETGPASLRIDKEEGGRKLMGGPSGTGQIRLQGGIGAGNSVPSEVLSFRYARPINPATKSQRFYIVAHRGGGRTADFIPHSENTVELIRVAERFGATGVEIDVRLSKDGIPFLYHDNGLNNRLVMKTPLVGPAEDYTFAQLRSFITLLKGEKIPSLDEALKAVVEQTTLKIVWLDSKSEEAGLLSKVVPIQQKYLQLAQQRGRDLQILIGMPSDAVYNEFLALPSYQSIPSLCELSSDNVRQANSHAWGPRWTRGTLEGEVTALRGEGRLVIPWTMDVAGYIREYVNLGIYDGILTNYPMTVAYYHYIR
jgi:glycerophosphoryl diester phosphodiesterase